MKQHVLRNLLSKFGIMGIIVILSLIAVIAGIGTTLLIAIYSAKPLLYLTGGAIIFVIVYLFGARLLVKFTNERKRQFTNVFLRIVGVLVFLGLTFSLLFPLQDNQRLPKNTESIGFWDLKSGSRIAYQLIQAKGNKQPYPIIFLHGGPGVPDMYGDGAYFGELAEDGYDVYVYDQVGSGRSSRLKDPREYTIERNVDDLALIREIIDAEKVILIGHSYGGEIAGHYLASSANNVEKTIFISPGALNPKDKSDGNLINHLTTKEKLGLFAKLIQPRVLMGYTLLQINPQAAYAFVGDDEMDARFDSVYEKTEPALHCRGRDNSLSPLSELGFYAHQLPQSAGTLPPQDPRELLKKVQTKALIIKGSCDYLSWTSAMDYKNTLTNSEIVYFPEAGHNVYQDEPKIVLQTIRAFLTDQPLPVMPYSDVNPPPDYGTWEK